MKEDQTKAEKAPRKSLPSFLVVSLIVAAVGMCVQQSVVCGDLVLSLTPVPSAASSPALPTTVRSCKELIVRSLRYDIVRTAIVFVCGGLVLSL